MRSLPSLPYTAYSCQVTSSKSATTAPAEEAERTRLTQAAVVDRALALADASGLDALTIRKLATELGVTPMALYWHFRGKEELLEGLAERVWSEIDISVDPAAAWPDQLRGLLESLLAVLRAHPAASELLMRKHTLSMGESALWTGIMLVMSEPGAELLDDDERTEMQRKKQVALATLSPARFPRLVECAVPLTNCDDPAWHYGFGVDMFMAGVTALAASRAGREGRSPR